jgi:AraC family transcriptional regulator, ethanolamine operon transcriptional activator
VHQTADAGTAIIGLVYTGFDVFENALQGVQGHYVRRAKQHRDWRWRIINLRGLGLMTDEKI